MPSTAATISDAVNDPERGASLHVLDGAERPDAVAGGVEDAAPAEKNSDEE